MVICPPRVARHYHLFHRCISLIKKYKCLFCFLLAVSILAWFLLVTNGWFSATVSDEWEAVCSLAQGETLLYLHRVHPSHLNIITRNTIELTILNFILIKISQSSFHEFIYGSQWLFDNFCSFLNFFLHITHPYQFWSLCEVTKIHLQEMCKQQ